MLDIAASYHCMQFQRKLMNQTWENRKKPSFEPDFGPFGPNLGHQLFFSKNWLCQSLDIMVSYHHVQYQKKLMIQSWENIVTDGQTDGQTDRRTRMISQDAVRLTSSVQNKEQYLTFLVPIKKIQKMIKMEKKLQKIMTYKLKFINSICLEWIYTLMLPESERTTCSKEARHLKIK